MTFKPYPWSTLFTLIGLGILIALGNWQLQRLGWKQDLIETTQARLSQSPVPLRDLEHSAKMGELDWQRIVVEGEFEGKEVHFYRRNAGKPGYYILSQLRRENGQLLLVARGFLPLEKKSERLGRPDDEIAKSRVEGVVQPFQPRALFLPENNPAENEWYYLSLEQLAEWTGSTNLAPYFVVDQERADPGLEPIEIDVNLPNNHLGYAITWFGLAAALLAVYVGYHVSEGRLVFRSRT